MRVLIGFLVHGILQTQQKSQLSLHAIEFSKPCVRMHYTALYNVEMADNGVEPRTSTTVIMRTFSMPIPHVGSQLASVSRASSILHSVSWVGSVALDLLCDRAYLFGHQHRFS